MGNSDIRAAQGVIRDQIGRSNAIGNQAMDQSKYFQNKLSGTEDTRNNNYEYLSGLMGWNRKAGESYANSMWDTANSPLNYQQFNGTQLGGYGNVGQVGQGLQNVQQLGDYKQLAEGFSPEAMAAMRANVMENTPAQFDQQAQAIKANLARRGMGGGQGGSLYGSGLMGNLASQKAMALAQGQRDITLQDEALRNSNMAANRQFNFNRDLSNVDISKWNNEFGMNRDLQNAQIQNLNRNFQFGVDSSNRDFQQAGDLANRNWALQQRQMQLGGQNQAFGANDAMMKNILSQAQLNNQTYDPSMYINGIAQMYGAANNANQTGMQGAGQNAQLATQYKSFWDKYGGALLGAGMTAATGGFPGLNNIFGGGMNSKVGPAAGGSQMDFYNAIK